MHLKNLRFFVIVILLSTGPITLLVTCAPKKIFVSVYLALITFSKPLLLACIAIFMMSQTSVLFVMTHECVSTFCQATAERENVLNILYKIAIGLDLNSSLFDCRMVCV